MTAAAIPIAIALAGAGANYAMQSSAQADAQRERNRNLLAQSQMTEATSRKNQANTVDTAKQYDPAVRTQALEDTAAKDTGTLTDYLKTVEGRDTGPSYGGKVTDDYLRTAGDRQAAELRYGRNLASLMGRVQAPGDLMRQEGFKNANTAVENATASSDLQGQLGAENIALQNIQPNGAKMLLGDLIGTGTAMYAGSKLGNPAAAKAGTAGAPRYTAGSTNYWAPTFRG